MFANKVVKIFDIDKVTKLQILIEDKIILNMREIQKHKAFYATLKELFTYKNPKHLENEKYGYSNYATPPYLYSYEILLGEFKISRGAIKKVIKHFNKFNLNYEIEERTLTLPSLDFKHSKTILRDEQEAFVSDLVKAKNGIGIGYTSFGKSISMLEVIARLRQPALIVVHTTFLQEQWIEEATDKNLFNMDKKDIGGVGGKFAGKKRRLGKINICLYQSLMKEDHLEFFKNSIGIIIFDEGQKSSIDDIQMGLNTFRAKYRFAVSAGVKRKDGKEFLIYDTFGEVVHTATEKSGDSKLLADIHIIESDYEDFDYEYDNDYAMMIARMAVDRNRNIAICRRLLKHHKQGRFCIVFVERKVQALIIAQMLSKFKVDMLLGATNWKDFVYEYEMQKLYDKKKNMPETRKIMLEAVTDKMIDIAKDYDSANAFKRITALASRGKLDFVIGTQKAEVGLSVRTFDYGLITGPMGNNLERFNQTLGRIERNFKDTDREYFGREKNIPLMEIIRDNTKASRNSALNIEQVYGDRTTIITNRRKL